MSKICVRLPKDRFFSFQTSYKCMVQLSRVLFSFRGPLPNKYTKRSFYLYSIETEYSLLELCRQRYQEGDQISSKVLFLYICFRCTSFIMWHCMTSPNNQSWTSFLKHFKDQVHKHNFDLRRMIFGILSKEDIFKSNSCKCMNQLEKRYKN